MNIHEKRIKDFEAEIGRLKRGLADEQCRNTALLAQNDRLTKRFNDLRASVWWLRGGWLEDDSEDREEK